MKPSPRRSRRAAFSLVEILVALAIISLFAAGVIGLVKGVLPGARLSRADNDIHEISAQLEAYQALTGFYPTTEQGLAALIEKTTKEPVPERWQQYLKRMPLDPWKTPYQYRCPGLHDTDGFDLYSFGPDKTESDDDITNWKKGDGHAAGGDGAGN